MPEVDYDARLRAEKEKAYPHGVERQRRFRANIANQRQHLDEETRKRHPNDPALKRTPAPGQFLPKLTPAHRECIAFGYPDMSDEQVATKFALHISMVRAIRGSRGMLPEAPPPASMKLPRIPPSMAHRAAHLDLEFLRRAVPLLNNFLQARYELIKDGRTETALDPHLEGEKVKNVPATAEVVKAHRAERAALVAAQRARQRQAEVGRNPRPDPLSPHRDAPLWQEPAPGGATGALLYD